MTRPSAVLPTVAVLLLAAGLVLFYFTTRAGKSPAGAPGTAAPQVNRTPAQPQPTAPNTPEPTLLAAAGSGDAAAVQRLLASPTKPLLDEPARTGMDVGLNALQLAASRGHSGIVRALIQAGAAPEARTADGWTPLMFAARAGSAETVSDIANAGAAVDAKNKAGETALIVAAKAGKAEAVRVLFNAGASVNAADEQGNTALAAAVSLPGRAEVVQLLLEANADPDIPDGSGATALMKAAERADPETVVILLNAGASATAKSSDGRTALDRARTRTDPQGQQVATVLDQAG